MKSWKQILKFVRNTWKYWWNENDDEILFFFLKFILIVSTISQNFEIYFLELTQEIVFGVTVFRASIYTMYLNSLALRKCKRDCKIPKIILVIGYCPLKTEVPVAWFSIRSCLNTSYTQVASVTVCI